MDDGGHVVLEGGSIEMGCRYSSPGHGPWVNARGAGQSARGSWLDRRAGVRLEVRTVEICGSGATSLCGVG